METTDLERNHWGSPTRPSGSALTSSHAAATVPSEDTQQLFSQAASSKQVGEAGAVTSQDPPGRTWSDKNGRATGNAEPKGEDEASDLEYSEDDDDEEAGLDPEGRRRKRESRKRETSIDGRIAGDVLTAKEERKLADLTVLRRSLINVLLIALWYVFSITISIYNKWMFSPNELDFHFPLFTTSMHMAVQFVLASTTLYFLPQYRPQHAVEVEEEQDPTQQQEALPSSTKKPIMTPWFYLSRIGPCGAATGLDIGLGNMSLKFISLTFFTMCKSSALAFVLLWAFIFRLEVPSLKLILIILTMTIGVVMMVFGETAFNALGFALIILSAFFSGFRWALTQILLLRNAATSNPFASIFFLTPVTFLTMFVLAIPIEGFVALGEGFARLAEARGTFVGVLLMLFPGTIAFCMMSAEYALLKRTSVVTLSICGIFKEVLTITASEIVYHDPLTPVNVSGLVVTIASIAAYNWIKLKKMREVAREDVVRELEGRGERVSREERREDGEAIGEEEREEGEDEGERARMLDPGKRGSVSG